MMTRLLSPSAAARVLGQADHGEVLDLLGRDPVDNVFIASRVATAGLDPWQLGGELWGFHVGGRLTSLCFSGANLVPVSATPEAVRAFADRARKQGRRCSSIVGPREPVLDLWGYLGAHWGAPREIRSSQPVMSIRESSPTVAPDFRIRPVRPVELDALMPACIAMFTEEVGVSPIGADGGHGYRQRVAELIGAGRAFARFEAGEVVFKAEIGSMCAKVGQIQGVWVHPDRRGHGLATQGTAAVVDRLVRGMNRSASLYVNAYNTPARAAYRRIGFRQVGRYATVLF